MEGVPSSKKHPPINLEEEAARAHPLVCDLVSTIEDRCSLVAAYVLLFLCLRSPRGVVCGKLPAPIVQPELLQPDVSLPCSLHRLLGGEAYLRKRGLDSSIGLFELFNTCQLNKLPINLAGSLLQFRLGSRPFVVLNHIPTVMEVLHQQRNGQRVVTVFLKQVNSVVV